MAKAVRLERVEDRIALAGRRLGAWWEGYAFDAEAERAALLASKTGLAAAPDIAIPELIWGAGRTGPGDPSWTTRHARALGLGARANVVVFGAERGAPMRDLKTGARWRVAGLTHAQADISGLDLSGYGDAMGKLNRGGCDGALAFFELYRDADPAAFARFSAEFLKPNAPIAFVDYAIARKGGRLTTCFPALSPGSPRVIADYQKALKDAGFAVGDPVDETRIFAPLIARGWSRWKRAYDRARGVPDASARAEALRFLSDYAALWAERYDAVKSGALQVVRLSARKSV